MEALPQSMLQAYVGISYGKLDPLAEDFSPLLAVSLFLSLFGAGSTLFAAETAARNVNELSPVRISAFSLYGLVSMLARAAEIAACVFWVALTSCAFKGFAAIAIVVIVVFMCFVNVMATSGDDRGSDSMLFFIKAMTWCCLILVAGILWLIFANVEHMVSFALQLLFNILRFEKLAGSRTTTMRTGPCQWASPGTHRTTTAMTAQSASIWLFIAPSPPQF